MAHPGVTKRPPSLGSRALSELHGKWSKSVIHEALVDLWLESQGLDMHPADLSPQQLSDYEKDVERRSLCIQRQCQGKPKPITGETR